jgi:tetratricopeptide (TPR) repeat protein
VDAECQGIRIAALRFDDAASVPDPSERLPSDIRAFLLQAKGWGLVWTGRHSAAKVYLERALTLTKEDLSSETYLYLLNIYSLSLFRTGDTRTAISLEHRIENALKRIRQNRCQLEYINSINLARLYRSAGDHAQAIAYYEKAFRTAEGVKSESDLVYENICLARVYCDAADHEQSFAHWFRAGLQYVAAAVPEALAPRVVIGLLHDYPNHRGDVVERVSEVLLRNIVSARMALGAEPDPENDLNCVQERVPSFSAMPLQLPNDRLAYGVSGNGWNAVLVSTAISPKFRGDHYLKLSSLLWREISLGDRGLAMQCGHVFVDADMPVDGDVADAKAVERCLRYRVSAVYCRGRKVSFAESDWARSRQLFKIKYSSAVDRVDLLEVDGLVYYRRYLRPRSVSLAEAMILRGLHDDLPVEGLALSFSGMIGLAEVETALLNLERDRVIDIYLPRDTYASEWMVPAGVRARR